MNEPPAGAAAPADPDTLESLEPLFRPRSVAVIGASRERGSIGAEIFHNLIEQGFRGTVYPVNPGATAVQAVRAYPSVGDIPDAVDLAVVVVPAARVLEALEACGRKGVRAAVVISAGFKETGAAGAARQQELVECARRHGMRLVGPNCLGVLNRDPAVSMDATFAPAWPPAGKVAFSSQSGALGLVILEYAAELGIGISQFISVGNKADVSGNDLLEFWGHDPGTDVILLYLESFGNPRRFLEIARRVGRRKPIVAVKSGRTTAGIRAASSHTGSLAGADTAVSALCSQAGVIRTDTMEELFDVAMLIANQPVPRGRGVGIVTNAGGPAIMASDSCESHGLEVAALADGTVEALRSFLPPEASVRNPVDMIASATPASYEKAVRLVANDPNVHAVLAIYVPPIVTRPLDVAEAIVRGSAAAAADAAGRGEAPKTVLTCFLGAHGAPEGLRSLHTGQIPSYAFPESAAIALSRAVRYGRWRDEPEGRAIRFDDVDEAATARIVAAVPAPAGASARAAWLGVDETRGLLAAYGIRMPAVELARDPESAVRAAERSGFPVAIKLASETITHKSDVGGVVLDVRTADEVRAAFTAIASRLAAAGHAPAEMAGVTIQPMVREGIEMIVGMARDPAFGPLVVLGLGGIEVELLKDVVFRVAPLTDRDAREMVQGLRSSALLAGYRGRPPGDVRALEETLLRFSQLVTDHARIAEVDLNPLRVLAPGRGCLALDARISVGG